MVGNAVEDDASTKDRAYLLVLSVCEGVRLVVDAASRIHTENATGRVGTPFHPGGGVDVSLHHGHEHLLHGVERRVQSAGPGAVEIIHVVVRVIGQPFPRRRFPNFGVITKKDRRYPGFFSNSNNPLIVISDAYIRDGERREPLFDFRLGQFIFVLRPRCFGVFGVEADRMPVHQIADENDLVTLVFVREIAAERQIAWMRDRGVDVAGNQYSHQFPFIRESCRP